VPVPYRLAGLGNLRRPDEMNFGETFPVTHDTPQAKFVTMPQCPKLSDLLASCDIPDSNFGASFFIPST
jgi:hypothetical protein